MNLHWRRNGFRLSYQIILALVPEIDPLSEVEVGFVEDGIRTKTTKPNFRVTGIRCGSHWVEMIADVDPGTDPTKAIANVKADITARIQSYRGDATSIWIPGYVISTIGVSVDAQEAAQELQARQGRK